MDIKKTIIQYRNIIIIGGFVAGAACWLDATGMYTLNLAESTYFKFGLIILIGFAGWTFNELFMGRKKRRPVPTPQNPMKNLEDIYPPEMNNQGGN